VLGVQVPPGLPGDDNQHATVRMQMTKVISFLAEVRAELEKITWPSREEFLGSTVVVCLLVAFFAVVLGAMDSIFSLLLKSVLR
jgi:preprotein translocase subunit SecE